MPRAKKLTVGIAAEGLPASAPLIRPLIKVEGRVHEFSNLEERGELPVLKSIGYIRVAPGSKHYVSYVITSKGREILDITMSEPDFKAIASDQSKVDFVTQFDDHDDELIQEGKPI